MKKLSSVVERLEQVLIALLLSGMVFVVSLQVFSRYALAHSLSWSEECARYTLVWITFLGAAVGVKRKVHIGIDYFVSKLPKKFQQKIALLNIFLTALFSGIVLKEGFSFVRQTLELGQRSPAMNVPMAVVYSVIPFSGVLMIFHLVEAFHQRLQKKAAS